MLNGLEGPKAPSVTVGETGPRPVRYREIYSPACAGLLEVIGAPVAACAAAAKPIPFALWENAPGAASVRYICTTFDFALLLVTCIFARPVMFEATPYGTITES